jgi:hypothetical protein
MTDAIKAAFDRERRAKEEHHAASLALSEAVAAYRAEHPAPGRQILALGALPRRGARHDGALPDECTREDYGFECGAVAVAWDTDGQALCRRHLEER